MVQVSRKFTAMQTKAPTIIRSRKHEELVQNLAIKKLNDMDISIFPTIRELLCFAALLGFSEKRKVPLDRSFGVEDISWQQFYGNSAGDLVFLLALAETKKPEILKDGEEAQCAEIFQEYANGGLEIISEALLKHGAEYPEKDIIAYLQENNFIEVDDKDGDFAGVTF